MCISHRLCTIFESLCACTESYMTSTEPCVCRALDVFSELQHKISVSCVILFKCCVAKLLKGISRDACYRWCEKCSLHCLHIFGLFIVHFAFYITAIGTACPCIHLCNNRVPLLSCAMGSVISRIIWHGIERCKLIWEFTFFWERVSVQFVGAAWFCVCVIIIAVYWTAHVINYQLIYNPCIE